MDGGSVMESPVSGLHGSELAAYTVDAPTTLFANITITDNQVSDDQLFVA
jgi:hypothetical protein